MAIQKADVESLRRLQVDLHQLLSLAIVVIKADSERCFTVHSQLNGESLEKGGFTGRARTGDANDPNRLVLTNLVGYPRNPFLVKSLVETHHSFEPTLKHGRVQLAHRSNPNHFVPATGFLIAIH